MDRYAIRPGKTKFQKYINWYGQKRKRISLHGVGISMPCTCALLHYIYPLFIIQSYHDNEQGWLWAEFAFVIIIGVKILWFRRTTSISIIRKKNKRITNGEDNYGLTNVDQLLLFTQLNMQRVITVKELNMNSDLNPIKF